MSKPLVSVVSPCFNDGDYLLECVESVKKSTYPNIEHIIINDGSTDKRTLEVLDSLRGQLKIIDTPNQGVCKARNQAIREAAGKYILPVDSDDKIASKYIELAVEELENNENVKLVTAPYELFGKFNKVSKLEPFSMERLLGHNLFIIISMFRVEDFLRVGGYNENMIGGLEDWDFWIAILKDGGQVKYLDGVQSYYRIKPTKKSRNANIDEQKHMFLRRQLWENHKDIFAIYFLDPLQTFEYMRVAKSKEYRFGKLLLAPIRKLFGK